MNKALKIKQYLIFIFLLAVSVLLAIFGYREVRRDMVLFRKGEQLLVKHDFQSAAIFLSESFRLGNSSPKLLKSLGEACRGAGRTQEAIEAYRLYLKQFPVDRTIRISLARLLTRHGHYNEAAVEYRKVLGDNP